MSDRKLNILVAYPYMKPDVIKILNDNQNDIRFLLDSGAFTAWKSGKEISVDDYCKFIESLPFKPWRYFTLDKIGDPQGSLKNYEIMLSRGFKPIPIFTRGEDVSMIDEYYKTSDVVGIGGLVGTQGNKGFVKGIMKIIGNRKVHWLGFTNIEFLKEYKPYMCDSSSTWSGQLFGSVRVYKGSGEFKILNRKDFHSKPANEVQTLIKKHGLNVNDFSKDTNWRGGKSIAMVLATRSFLLYQKEVFKNLKTYNFCACATLDQVKLLIENKEILK